MINPDARETIMRLNGFAGGEDRRALALELGKRGVRVNSVHSGIVDAAHDRNIPAAGAELFLASDQNSHCTGAELVVDGGHLAGPYRDNTIDG